MKAIISTEKLNMNRMSECGDAQCMMKQSGTRCGTR